MMKKTMIIMLTLMVTLFCSCSSSSDSKENILNGTKWNSTEEVNGKVLVQWTLTFSSSSFTLKLSADEDFDGEFDRFENISGTYTLDGNDVTMSANGGSQSGTVNGNILHLYENESSDEFFFNKE